SPEHRRYAVAVTPRSADKASQVEIAWRGAPENSVGGLYRSGAGAFSGRAYQIADDGSGIDNLPITHWSTKSLSSTWTTEASQPVVDSALENMGTGQLRGRLTLHLDEPLVDCMLVANGWAYIPTTTDATLKPGVEWQLTGGRSVLQRELKALLTGEKQTRRKREDRTGPEKIEITTSIENYQPLGRNRSQQVPILTFHQAAGGSAYTGLSNAALRNLELTDLMQLGRAILIGRKATSPAQVTIDGQPATPTTESTWVRLVLPVVSRERAPEKYIPKEIDPRVQVDPKAGGSRD
ncbi:MAG: hypothetical protein JSS02_11880, partial [Planctomycetes bacterium]|nr:hypothetical protein [Planctomycetota bacterium]